MIHSSWVWVAWVSRARSGRATFSDAIAAVTAASARQTTAVTAVLLTGRDLPGRNLAASKPASPATRTAIMVASGVSKRRNIRYDLRRPRCLGVVNNEYSFFIRSLPPPPRCRERRDARRHQ